MFFKESLGPCHQINDYELERPLGRGGMGSVHLARHRPSGQRVALKVGASREEAHFLRQLVHPRLPEIYAWSEAGLVMEYLEGTALPTRVSEEQLLEWADQLCEVLEYLHQQRVIFRDLKPSNVILTAQGLKLVDFGIAKQAQAVTRALVRGLLSRGYAAPELYHGTGTDERTDVYALGATLYFAFTGQAPPESVDVERGLVVNLTVRGLRPDVSGQTETALAAMMEVDPEKRPGSMAAVREALKIKRPG